MDFYNKDQRKEYNKKYYQEKKLEKGLKPIICDICGKTITSNSYKYHLNTAKCKLAKLHLDVTKISS